MISTVTVGKDITPGSETLAPPLRAWVSLLAPDSRKGSRPCIPHGRPGLTLALGLGWVQSWPLRVFGRELVNGHSLSLPCGQKKWFSAVHKCGTGYN